MDSNACKHCQKSQTKRIGCTKIMLIHKTYRLLAIIATLFFTLPLKSTTKVVSCDASEIKFGDFIPSCKEGKKYIRALSLIGAFAQTRELFILVRLHKDPEERTTILKYSDVDRRVKFYDEIEKYKQNRKELRRKQNLLYPKCALRTCSYVVEAPIKIAGWTALACTIVASHAVESVCILSSMFIAGSLSYLCCTGRPGEHAEACGECCSKITCFGDPGAYNGICLDDPCWKATPPCESFNEDISRIEWHKSQSMVRD